MDRRVRGSEGGGGEEDGGLAFPRSQQDKDRMLIGIQSQSPKMRTAQKCTEHHTAGPPHVPPWEGGGAGSLGGWQVPAASAPSQP